jgi:hypothetical protein
MYTTIRIKKTGFTPVFQEPPAGIVPIAIGTATMDTLTAVFRSFQGNV